MKFFGTIKYEKGRAHDEPVWKIKAEPHVMLRLKRHFPRVSQKLDELVFTDTLEVCRDLEWFLSRYPLEADKKTQKRITDGAREHERHEQQTHDILSLIVPGDRFELAEPARDYQMVGAELAYHVRGLLLADDMGLGKTVTALCLLTRPETRPALVSTKTALPWQWERMVKRFAPSLRTHVITKGSPVDGKGKRYELGRIERGADGKPVAVFPDVVITNHHKLSGWRDELAGKFRTVIWDEGQAFRNPETAMSSAAYHIRSKATWCMMLTGTPIHNLGDEMHPIVDLVQPGRLGDREEFLQEWCNRESRGKGSLKDPDAFGSYLRAEGLMLRRTRKDVGRELPGLTNVIEYIDADTDILKKIRTPATELARIILQRGVSSSQSEQFNARGQFEMLMRQQTGIAKALSVAEYTKMAVENGEPVLLFGWHHAVYNIWKEQLKEYEPAWFTGQESGKAKEESALRFIKGETPVLIMSLRAGEGLDGLQAACKTVIYGELDWSPAVHEQDTARVFRDGQEHPVFAYYLLSDSDESSDPILSDMLGIKRAQLEGVRDPGGKSFLAELDTGGHQVKRLAEAYLRKVKAA